jgi:hypothetical protein
MKKTLCTLLGTGLLCAAFQLSAQEPPPVLRIFREDIKEGRGMAHEKSEMKFAQAMARNKYPANVIAMTTLSGTTQAWFVEAHTSFVSIGQANAAMDKIAEFGELDALDGEYRASSRSWIAVYHPEMSYHGTQLMQTLPKARYFNVINMRIRLEHDQEFAQIAKMAVTAAEKSGDDQPIAVYQVVSGAPTGTYLLFEPSASLQSMDDGPARGRAMFAAMGSEAAKFVKNAGDTIVTSEALLFQINPKMSYPSKEFAAGDPDFWTPKAAKSASAKPAAKPVAAK